MTQDIRIAHHGASGAEAVTRRAALEDKDQAEGFGVRALAVLFIGFAVYLKTFFNASQAEDTGAVQDQPAPVEAAQTDTANMPAPADPAVAMAPSAPVRPEGKADKPTVAQEAEAGSLTLVALGLPGTTEDSGSAAGLDAPGTGNIARDPTPSDPVAIAPGATAQPGPTGSVPAPGLPSGAAPGGTVATTGTGGDTTSHPTTDTGAGADTDTADSPRIYDIASLFQDIGLTLQDRPDSLVDRVTDLAIGDLMRDMTLDAFRAHLGPIPQDPGRPLEQLVSVLTDDGSREAFLARTGLMQGEPLDASYGPDPSFSHTATEPDTGPDLFL